MDERLRRKFDGQKRFVNQIRPPAQGGEGAILELRLPGDKDDGRVFVLGGQPDALADLLAGVVRHDRVETDEIEAV